MVRFRTKEEFEKMCRSCPAFEKVNNEAKINDTDYIELTCKTEDTCLYFKKLIEEINQA